MYPWNSWRTLFPLIVGFAGTVGFGLHERRLSRKAYDDVGDLLPGNKTEPIIRFSIFTNATLIITYFETVVHGIVLWSLLYFLPLYYEAVQGYTPIISGVAILPETGLVAPISVIAAFLCTITGRYRWALWGGWMFTSLGSGLLFLLGPHTSVTGWIFLNFPVSIGTGMLFPAMGLGVQAACRPQDSGHAAAFFSFLRTFGQSIGVAISGVAFQNQIHKTLLTYPTFAPLAGQYSKDATALVNIIKEMPDGSQKSSLIRAYSDSLHVIWLLMTIISGTALVSSYFTKEFTLIQEHKSKQGFKRESSALH